MVLAAVDALAQRYGLSPLAVIQDYAALRRIAQGADAWRRYQGVDKLLWPERS